MKNRIRKMHLSSKLSVMVAIGVCLATLLVGIISTVLFYNECVETQALYATGIAKSVAAEFEADEFLNVMNTGVKNEYYDRTKGFLDRVKRSAGTRYLYVVTDDGANVKYYGSGELVGETRSGFLEVEEKSAYAEEMLTTLSTGEPTVTAIYDEGGYGGLISGFAAIKDDSGKVVGVVGADVPVEAIGSNIRQFLLQISAGIFGMAAVLTILAVLLVKKFISKPIVSLASTAKKLAKGDIDVVVEVKSEDELGTLAEAFREMIETTREQVEVFNTVSNGDLTVSVKPRSDKDSMGFALSKLLDQLNEIFGEISNSTQQVSLGSNQIATGAQLLAQGSCEQASAIEELSASVAEISTQVAENAENATMMHTAASAVILNTETGGERMKKMLTAVDEIKESSHTIRSVIKQIDDIAFQTNILALNAAVEAARAGAQGKGFSVVAEEVRNLAGKSAEAAKSTSNMIDDCISKADAGSQLAMEAALTFKEIYEGIHASADLMGKIASASAAQNDQTKLIYQGIDQISSVVAQNSATAEESAASSEELSGQATSLSDMISQYRLRK